MYPHEELARPGLIPAHPGARPDRSPRDVPGLQSGDRYGGRRRGRAGACTSGMFWRANLDPGRAETGQWKGDPDMTRLVVLISGNGTNLQAILDASASGDLPAQVCAVISNQVGAYGLERARLAGVP